MLQLSACQIDRNNDIYLSCQFETQTLKSTVMKTSIFKSYVQTSIFIFSSYLVVLVVLGMIYR